jgi:sugar/nucleoside kinase (ribokinase family)
MAEQHFDYTTVGHVTTDVMPDGTRRAGGSAFYSALQAARLGLRALIITQGPAPEILELLSPHAGELQVRVLEAGACTVLSTSGMGPARSQRILSWAGAMPDGIAVGGGILHLAPVARETPSSWDGSPEFVGLTPQGLARRWRELGDEVEPAAPVPAALEVAADCDAIVLNQQESEICTQLIERGSSAGAIVSVTAEGGPNTLRLPGGSTVLVPVPPLGAPPAEDLGAGDVDAAALFVSLAQGSAPEDAARFANAAAAVRMLGRGSDAVGDRAAVLARLRSTEASAPHGA